MDEDKLVRNQKERAMKLLEKRKAILSMPAEDALNEILEYPEPFGLVHSFPEEDLYFLMHDVGPDDFLPVLSMASGRQWEYILDMEVWEQDRINVSSVTVWLDLLFQAEPSRLMKWILEEKTEFFEFFLFKNVEIRIREHDEDPSVFGDDFFTLDDVFYVRVIDFPGFGGSGRKTDDPDAENEYREFRETFIIKVLEYMASIDHVKYQNVLLETVGVTPAETEEEAFRLKNVRLAEKGFLPFDEAVGIYQPVTEKEFRKRGTRYRGYGTDFYTPATLYPAGIIEGGNPFSTALAVIDSDEMLAELQTEFAALCNRIISADQKTIRGRDELADIVKKACGYLNIGLEVMAGRKIDDPVEIALQLKKYQLLWIFRTGYGIVMKLKWRAEKWKAGSWYLKNRLPLSFWGERWVGFLGGLLVKRPKYFADYRSGELYSEFSSLKEVREAESALDEVETFDLFFSLMGVSPEAPEGYFLSSQNMVLTLWARSRLGLSETLLPIEFEPFKKFYESLWEGDGSQRAISLKAKEAFLNWLSDKTGLTAVDISERAGRSLESLFDEIESEYGAVNLKNLDPRYINLFFVSGDSKQGM